MSGDSRCNACPRRDDIRLLYPKLHKVALYCLGLPVSVTSCDSVLSVMGNAFTVRSNALHVNKAARLLAFNCNGDFLNKTFAPQAFPGWGE